jgi:DNA-binding CsgD family transcriptional regulator
MSITTDRIAKANGIEQKPKALDAAANSHLFEALSGVLDSLISGILVVGDRGRILHANATAQEMLEAKSPIVSLAGFLCALHGERTKALRLAIASVQSGRNSVGVPLVDKSGAPASAHIVPLIADRSRAAQRNAPVPVAVFVMLANAAMPADIDIVAHSFRLTQAESRLLQHLVAGVSLNEAAAALGVAEATARTHRNHIFTKTGVSRRSDLLLLVSRLVPPIRRRH